MGYTTHRRKQPRNLMPRCYDPHCLQRHLFMQSLLQALSQNATWLNSVHIWSNVVVSGFMFSPYGGFMFSFFNTVVIGTAVSQYVFFVADFISWDTQHRAASNHAIECLAVTTLTAYKDIFWLYCYLHVNGGWPPRGNTFIVSKVAWGIGGWGQSVSASLHFRSMVHQYSCFHYYGFHEFPSWGFMCSHKT